MSKKHHCGYKYLNLRVNVGKKRYKDLVMDCFGKINNKFNHQ